MPFRQVFVGGASAVAMRAGELEMVVLPAENGRVARLRRGRGREWLRPGTDGGWTERLTAATEQNVLRAPERLQAAVGHHDVREHPLGVSLASDVPVPGVPLVFRRELTLLNDRPVVQCTYGLLHTGGAPLLWLWHPQMTWTSQAGTAVYVPTLHQVRIAEVRGRDDVEAGDLVAWPGAIGGDAARFQMPAALPWSLHCHGDLGPVGRLTMTDPKDGEFLTLTTDPSRVPHVGLGLRAGHGDDEPPALEAALRIGVPDELAAAHALGTAPMISEGEERIWGFEIRLGDPALDIDPAPPSAELT